MSEVEVEAAARALNPMAWAAYDQVDEDSEMRESLVEHTRITARAMLAAVEAVREPPTEVATMLEKRFGEVPR